MTTTNNSMITSLNNIKIDKNNNNTNELDDPEIKNLLKKLDKNTIQENKETQGINYNQQNTDVLKQQQMQQKIQQQEMENMRRQLEEQKRLNEINSIQKEMENKLEFNDFEDEMDNLIGTSNNMPQLSSSNKLNTGEKKIINKDTIVKCIIIIIISFLITNSKLLVLFQKIIPENIYTKLNNNQNLIYYLILFVVLYLLYYFNYI